MKKKYCLFLFLLSISASSQIGINTMSPHSSSMLEVSSTDKGILIPRMTSAERTAIASPATGLLVYDTTLNKFYYYDGTTWTPIEGSGANYWTLSGTNLYNNSGTNVGIGTTTPTDKLHVLGTARIDGGKLDFRNTGQSVFIGEGAGNNDDFTNNNNVGVGYKSLNANTSGSLNSSYGFESLMSNDTGSRNAAFGYQSLKNNTTGSQNTAFGYGTLLNNTASGNTAFGYESLMENTSGNSNQALGYQALWKNTTGNNNVAIGLRALLSNTTNSNNVAVGYRTLYSATANDNTGLGYRAGTSTTTGHSNLFAGSSAGSENSTGTNNVYLGYRAGTNSLGSGNLFIGNQAGENEITSNKLYIDNSNTSSPLLYGEFDTNLFRVNGTLNINNAYSLPTADGTSGFILQTNGTGTVNWVNPSTLTITETDPQISSAITNTVPKWNGTTLTDGMIYDTGTNIGIGTTPLEKLHINGSARIDGGKLDFRNTGQSTFIGEYAGSNDDNTNNQNTAIGAYSQFNTTSGYRNVSNGTNTLYSNTTGYNNVAIGFNASLSNSTGYGNVAIGEGSLYFNQTGSENVAIGKLSGIANLGSGNVFIGNSAGANELGSNKLYIDNSNTSSPLLYGEFDSNLFRINGSLNINSAYTFPTTDGTANYVLQTNGSGLTSWVNPNSLSINESDPQVSSITANKVPKWDGTTLTDGIILDNGTNVGIGTTTPADKLHVLGTARIDGGKLDFRNTGRSTFIGESAGLNDDFTANENSALGAFSLYSNTSGYRNVGNGAYALYLNTTGYNNVAIGFNSSLSNTTGFGNVAIGEGSLYFNQTGNENVAIGKYSGIGNLGSGNVFIGNNAGANESGSNKLYIDNNNTLSPLIYGEFDNDLVRINGSKLEVQNATVVDVNVKSTTSSSAVNVTSPNANDATFFINTLSGANSLKRWGLGKANNNEAGSNAGSFFVLNRYDDSGAYLGQPMLINRTTGSMTIGNDNVSTADHTLKVNGSMSLKVMTVVTSNNTTTLDGDDYSIIYGGSITGNTLVLPAANTCTGRVYLIINHSSSSVTISSYITANGTTSTAVANGLNLQIMSDGTNWHRIN